MSLGGMRIADLDTPSVLVDLDVLERNIAEMADLARGAGVALRPHIKTHKTPEIARMQLDAGAVGITCAKIGEAEALADAGLTDFFIAHPLVTAQKARRLAELARRPGVTVATIADSPEGVAALSAVFAGERMPLDVLVKVDTGLARVGVLPGEPTIALAQQIAAAPGLRFAGICAHEGYSYGRSDPAERDAVTRAGVETLVATARELADAGLPAERVSVGSTPGAKAAIQVPGVTEVRPGNYAFYDAMQVGLGVVPVERCALSVLVTVVSHAARDRAVVDGGSKTFTSDKGVHGMAGANSHGIILGKEDVTLHALSEEHGWLRLDPSGSDVAIGEQLRVIPIHSCPVANLAEDLVVVRGDKVVARWGVAAAGRVR
jgi:D-serine deaminase-like pyridoxal phosphate-dependent protein